jgi:formamidopyrimidine-DNA glycosylase
MPELPEVETIRRGLLSKIVSKKIASVEVENAKSFQGKAEDVTGRKILNIERRAKNIRLKLEGGVNILIHMKMTGQLIFIDHNKRFAGGHPSHDWHALLPNKHTRVTFAFDDGTMLFFNDLRKFGWCKVMTDEEIEKVFSLFGPEPFSGAFTVDYLQKRAERIPARTIKQFIMDQEIIAGIGNIYADESLFCARLMPRTKVGFLNKTDWEKLRTCILEVLEKGIKYGGTTDSDYVDAEGKKGGMQNYLNVYHKTGESCPICGGEVEKIKLGGRGTYYCPRCQKEKK